ncbi:MAG: lysophospholipid acyltransferase family protein [Desulfobacterales bacterium]|jgi:KDO2-lipid IV(A) lauroyltransferase
MTINFDLHKHKDTSAGRTGKNLNRFVAGIGRKHILRIGKFLGRLAYVLDVPHRRIVRRNLAFAYPDWSQTEIKRISGRIFQNLGITFVEILQLFVLSKADILARIEVVGLEHLQRAQQSRKGLIIISGHLGSWEMGLLYACCILDKPSLGVAKKFRFGPLNRRIHDLRTRFGLKIVYKKGAVPEMRKMLRHGGIIGLLVDQSRRSEGVEVTFFGRKVTATPAAAFLALRYKCPVLPIFCVRKANGQLIMEVKAPLEILQTGDLRSDLQTNTQRITDAVEEAVRRYPDQWFWIHKRWKKFYPDLYPEYQARRKRRRVKKKSIPNSAG